MVALYATIPESLPNKAYSHALAACMMKRIYLHALQHVAATVLTAIWHEIQPRLLLLFHRTVPEPQSHVQTLN